MAAKGKPADGGQEPQPKGMKTQKLNVWLTPEQVAWLKADSQGASKAVRALITEAMAMDNLRKSLSTSKKAKASPAAKPARPALKAPAKVETKPPAKAPAKATAKAAPGRKR